MSDPYQNKPKLQSEANQWHEMSFQISVDQPVDWQNVDLRKWASLVGKYTAALLAKSTETKDNEYETVRALFLNVKVDRVTFVDDEGLHNMIDEFGDDE